MREDIIYAELSYKLTGLFFQVHNELGRFCREKQYADRLEKLLREKGFHYEREVDLFSFEKESPVGNRVDFIVENQVVIELKAKAFVTKDDYYQTQRYLRGAGLRLGLIVNFRNKFLKPKRILHALSYSNHSHGDSQHSHRIEKL